MKKENWRVQAILKPSPGGPSEPYRYAAQYFRWKWQARRERAALRRSFGRDMATITLERAQ